MDTQGSATAKEREEDTLSQVRPIQAETGILSLQDSQEPREVHLLHLLQGLLLGATQGTLHTTQGASHTVQRREHPPHPATRETRRRTEGMQNQPLLVRRHAGDLAPEISYGQERRPGSRPWRLTKNARPQSEGARPGERPGADAQAHAGEMQANGQN